MTLTVFDPHSVGPGLRAAVLPDLVLGGDLLVLDVDIAERRIGRIEFQIVKREGFTRGSR
jgi:hypothetical protein